MQNLKCLTEIGRIYKSKFILKRTDPNFVRNKFYAEFDSSEQEYANAEVSTFKKMNWKTKFLWVKLI